MSFPASSDNRTQSTVLAAVRLTAAILLGSWLATLSPDVRAQLTPQNSQPRGAATVEVRVVGDNGTPLENSAEVTLSSEGQASGQTQDTGSNGLARFARVASGNYTVSARAPGFKEAATEVQVPMNYGTFETTVAMEQESSTDSNAKGTVLAPKAKKEFNDGIAAMRLGHYDEAQKHFEAAYKLAPGDPNVNGMMGELFLIKKDLAKAEDFLARSISIDPGNVNALTDMGQVRIQQRDYVSAEIPLQHAIALSPQNWFGHWLLGVAYLRLNENEKARLEAVAAMRFGKGAAIDAGYLLGESLAALGRNIEAVQALQAFLKASPNNSYASAAQSLIGKLQNAPSTSTAQPAAENFVPPQ